MQKTALASRITSLLEVALLSGSLLLSGATIANAASYGKVAVTTQRMTSPTLKSTQVGWYKKGSKLALSCYQRGQSVKGHFSPWIPGGWDNLWYKVSDGRWVADVDIDTGSNKPVVRACATTPAPTTAKPVEGLPCSGPRGRCLARTEW